MTSSIARGLTTALVLAIASAAMAACGCPARAPSDVVDPITAPIYTSKELNEGNRQTYYHLDEGIQYLPIDVMLSLSRAKSGDGGADPAFGLFKERFLEKPERFGLFRLPNHDVPVGLTISNDEVPMAGINCATCHTAIIRIVDPKSEKKQFLVVDGAPSLFAVNRFVSEIAISLIATRLCSSEFDRFYDRYVMQVELRQAKLGVPVTAKALETKDAPQPEESKKQDELEKQYGACEEKGLKANDPALLAAVAPLAKAAKAPTGTKPLTRAEMKDYLVDRFKWFNELGGFSPKAPPVGAADLGRSNPWGVSKNYLADRWLNVKKGWQQQTGGPISTPHIWGFANVEHIFWSGVTNSLVERDYAQGIALLSPFDPECSTFKTTVSIKKLHEVRRYPAALTAPSWPEEVLGAIDRTRAANGQKIYAQLCQHCHDKKPAVDRAGNPRERNVEEKKCHEVGPRDAAGNVITPAPGGLQRYLFCDVGSDAFYTRSLQEPAPGKRLTCTAPVQSGPGDLLVDFLGPVFGEAKHAAYRNEGLNESTDYKTYEGEARKNAWWLAPKDNAYVAKPLKGIWATAPYLHNGSVPDLMTLLTPSDRPKQFWIGPIDFDAANVGFRYREADSVPYRSLFDADAPGSSNRGHEGPAYGTDLSPDEKRDLLEYIKAL